MEIGVKTEHKVERVQGISANFGVESITPTCKDNLKLRSLRVGPN